MAFCSGNQKQVRDKRFDVSHLTNVRKITFFGLTKTITYHKDFPLKEKAICKCAMFKRFIQTKLRALQVLTLEFFEKWTLCLFRSRSHFSYCKWQRILSIRSDPGRRNRSICFLFSSSKLTSYH